LVTYLHAIVLYRSQKLLDRMFFQWRCCDWRTGYIVLVILV